MSEKARNVQSSGIAEFAQTIGYAVLIAVLIRAFLFQPFNIPSGSMIPTLLVGDYLFVSKYSYGYSKHSLPFSPPLFDGRIFDDKPERGDVIVFRLPTDSSQDYIKRLVGLPGDTVQMKAGVLYINAVPVKRERVEDFIDRSPYLGVEYVPQYLETLPNGVSYMTLDRCRDCDLGDNTGVYRVPEGHYFMMGDNRDSSKDSRYSAQVGYVPHENLVGKAQIIFFSTDGTAGLWHFWRWFSAARWNRLFDFIN